MSIHFAQDPFVASKVIDLLSAERERALSVREWKHRIAGYGYGIKATDAGPVVTLLPKGTEICVLPDELRH